MDRISIFLNAFTSQIAAFTETRLVLMSPRQCGSVSMLCLTLIHTNIILCVISPVLEVLLKLSEDVAQKDKRTRRCGQCQT